MFNQFTEQFVVSELAKLVKEAAAHKGRTVEIRHVPDPRVEAEKHYYNAKHTKLIDLGLQPRLLSETLIDSIFDKVDEHKHRREAGSHRSAGELAQRKESGRIR